MPNKNPIKTWMSLSRLPFHSVGVLPFVLGSMLGWRVCSQMNIPVFGLGLAAVVLIMLMTYLNGECFDIKEDSLSAKIGKNPFSGGSQLIVHNIVDARRVKAVSLASITAACAIGLLLQFYYKTGAWTIPLGATGILAGGLYSLPPIRLVKWGIGEMLIGYCYGWLPIAVGFYLQSDGIAPIVHWMAIPVACTIFNVILINEFPDYVPDATTGKRNLLVRIGKKKAAKIYAFAAAISWIIFFVSARMYFPYPVAILYFPVFLLSAVVAVMMLIGYYDKDKLLMFMCGSTIIINLATTAIYIAGVVLTDGKIQ